MTALGADVAKAVEDEPSSSESSLGPIAMAAARAACAIDQIHGAAAEIVLCGRDETRALHAALPNLRAALVEQREKLTKALELLDWHDNGDPIGVSVEVGATDATVPTSR